MCNSGKINRFLGSRGCPLFCIRLAFLGYGGTLIDAPMAGGNMSGFVGYRGSKFCRRKEKLNLKTGDPGIEVGTSITHKQQATANNKQIAVLLFTAFAVGAKLGSNY